MQIVWQIDAEDIAKVQEFFNQHRESPFVQTRIETNLRDDKPPITKDDFWERMVGCLLTTQQRSGPDSSVTRFLLTRPFPLDYRICTEKEDLSDFARNVISDFGGLRRSTTIGNELAANMKFLADGGWEATFKHLDEVRLHYSEIKNRTCSFDLRSPEVERWAAEFFDEHLKGFGPKQPRNLLQGLGLSRYEIPLDSRITRWLNAFGFPVTLTANALADRNYYNFVSDGFQQLCKTCEIMPCVLDAAIFSSFDKGEWTEDNVVW